MAMPKDIGVIDTMLSIPSNDRGKWYDFMKSQLLDKESREMFEFPVEYMFKDVPETKRGDRFDDYVAYTLSEMDKYGIAKALVGVTLENEDLCRALKENPDRFIGSYQVNPNTGMEGVRDLRRAVKELNVKAATSFPAGCLPQVPIADRRMYPLYAACVDLDIPIFVCAGVPGPRLPMACQHVEQIDEVCYFFPELRFVTRHGCEPWTELIVKLMLKYPNLYYSTSAFAPRYYPGEVIDYANSRGGDRLIYAGYFPMGLSLERIFAELEKLPLKDEVWPGFLRDNAARVLKLDQA
ncbi:MAG: amidohydrolase [Proteobacteria bacterium]|nr:amidohydrolase [Pseudomonadota bacterium]